MVYIIYNYYFSIFQKTKAFKRKQTMYANILRNTQINISSLLEDGIFPSNEIEVIRNIHGQNLYHNGNNKNEKQSLDQVTSKLLLFDYMFLLKYVIEKIRINTKTKNLNRNSKNNKKITINNISDYLVRLFKNRYNIVTEYYDDNIMILIDRIINGSDELYFDCDITKIKMYSFDTILYNLLKLHYNIPIHRIFVKDNDLVVIFKRDYEWMEVYDELENIYISPIFFVSREDWLDI